MHSAAGCSDLQYQDYLTVRHGVYQKTVAPCNKNAAFAIKSFQMFLDGETERAIWLAVLMQKLSKSCSLPAMLPESDCESFKQIHGIMCCWVSAMWSCISWMFPHALAKASRAPVFYSNKFTTDVTNVSLQKSGSCFFTVFSLLINTSLLSPYKPLSKHNFTLVDIQQCMGTHRYV